MMRKHFVLKHFVLLSLFLLIFVACDSGYEVIDKTPNVTNKYNSSQPTSLSSIDPTYGIIDETFIVNGNFPGKVSDLKVYFGSKSAVLTATDGQSIVGLVPKELNGYNQISLVAGKDSIAPSGLLFKYHQSQSVKTISGKLGTNAWLADADYAGTALDAVTYGELDYVATVAGVKADNVFVVATGWSNSLFMLSIDDNTVTKISTPTNLSAMAVPSTRDMFYTTNFWNGGNTIYLYAKENSWAFVNTGITIPSTDWPGTHTPSTTFGADDNLLYLLDDEGRIAEVNITDKSYKIYTTSDKKPVNLDASNWGGYITGSVLPSNFGSWEDSYICYSKYHNCFFVSYTNENAIYKYVKNADNSWTCELYAGKNGQGSTVGNRLTDAQFTSPHGMVVNSEGDIFVCNKGGCSWCSNGHCINKISGNAVSIIAGNPSSISPLVNGGTDPLSATFNTPMNLAIDYEGNYYIAGGNDCTVRKLSIE
jgi:hypothetical protein